MLQNKPLFKVFLCYVEEDIDAVQGLYKRLRKGGVDAWLNKERLLPGQDWEFEIRKAVREADAVVVCLSKNFNHSGFPQKEVRLALDTAMEKPEGTIFIIPARLENCNNLESLKKWYLVDLFEKNGYEMLLRALSLQAEKVGARLQNQKVPSTTNNIQVPIKKNTVLFANKLINKKSKSTNKIRSARIFISYKRNADPDTLIAKLVFEALRDKYAVFIDTTIQIGERWAEKIQSEIRQADFFIIFLSEHSANSEMVIAEVESAYQHNKETGKPLILPVRLNYFELLIYPLNSYLNPLQWAIWENDSDTPKLISDLYQAISGGQLPIDVVKQSDSIVKHKEEIPTAYANILRDMGSPEGTMPHKSPLYIERNSDQEALQALCEIEGVTITIKGPRQMGKSSLLNRLMLEGCNQKMRTAFIDFQMLENAVIANADIFYRQFCSLLSWEFGVDDRTEETWKLPLGHVQKTTNYVHKQLLKEIPNVKVLLAMDEVERMFASPFRSDFFSMLRSWHNNRARGGDWTRFNMALVTSTEPYQFIADLNQSPFNVGQIVELSDFSLQQVDELNQRHHHVLSKKQIEKLFELLHGHPYLTRKALYLIASQKTTFIKLMDTAIEDDGPFGDHLRNYLFRMSDQEKLRTGFVHVIKYNRCPDEHIFFQLRGAGLVKRDDNIVTPRNQLYADYFRKRLNG